MLTNLVHTRNAQEPESVSFLYNLFSFKGCNSGGRDEQFRVRGGTQAIPLASAARYKESLELNAVVTEIQAQGHASGVDGVAVRVVKSKHTTVINGSAVILTGPPPMVLGIRFSPPLDGFQAQLMQRMPMGTVPHCLLCACAPHIIACGV